MRRERMGVWFVPPGGVLVAAEHTAPADPVRLCDVVLHDLERVLRSPAVREPFRGRGLVARVVRGERAPAQRADPRRDRGERRTA